MSITIETAGDMMSHPAFCLTAGTKIGEAAHTLVTKHIHGAPVLDDDGKFVGTISEANLLSVVANAAFHSLPVGDVADHMTTDPVTVDVKADIYEVTRLFRDGLANRLPVMDEGRCVGIITRRNLLLALQRLARFHDKAPTRTYDLLARLRG